MAVAVFFVWRFVIQPWRRDRTLGLDGMLILSAFLLWFWDPAAVNYLNNTFAYNSHFVNLGSWANFIPGWHAPNQNLLPEPLLLVGGGYIWWAFGSTRFLVVGFSE